MEYNIKPMEFEADKDGNLIDVPEMIDRVIEKRGHIIEFTISGVEANIKHNNKNLIEMEANHKLAVAKMDNIEHFHDFVRKMSEEDLFTAHMYQEYKNTTDMFASKIEEIGAQIKSDTDELVAIKSQIAELNIESPYDSEEATAGEDQE